MEPELIRETAVDVTERRTRIVLAIVLIVAAGLRLWGIRHGLPYAYNLDERSHFVRKAVLMTGGDLDPHYFVNPAAFTYLLAIVLSIVHLQGGVEHAFATDPGSVWLTARLVSAALGVAAVAATYAAGRAWFTRRVGLLAAAVLAVAFLPAFYSRLALNDGPAVLPCALALWAAAVVFRTGKLTAFAAAGACVGLAAAMKYSDGAVVIALVVAAVLGPGVSGLRQTAAGLAIAAGAAAIVFIATNPYAVLDAQAFLDDLDRQRRYTSGPPLLGQSERNGWLYYAASSRWAFGIVPAVLSLAGGLLLAARRRREALVFGALIVLFWLYMGSQTRFYVRWMLPLYPALAVLAGYATAEVILMIRRPMSRSRLAATLVPAVAAIALLLPSLLSTARNARVLSRLDTRSETRAWLVAHVPAGTRVVFEPVAPREWYGRTAGGGAQADPHPQWTRFHRTRALIRELAREFPAARQTADFQNYVRTLTPALVPIYEREAYCWVVSGSTQSGRARADPDRVPSALAYYRRLRAASRIAFVADSLKPGATPPPYQVDRSFNYVDGAYERPGPVMTVYRLTGGRCTERGRTGSSTARRRAGAFANSDDVVSRGESGTRPSSVVGLRRPEKSIARDDISAG